MSDSDSDASEDSEEYERRKAKEEEEARRRASGLCFDYCEGGQTDYVRVTVREGWRLMF